MDVLHIPFMQGEDRIATALDRLYATRSKAVVVAMQREYYLYRSRDIVVAFKDKLRFCSDLRKEWGRPVVDMIEDQGYLFRNLETNSKSFFPLQSAIETYLDEKKKDYGMLFYSVDAPSAGMVTLITRHEGFKADIQDSETICICTGPGEHMEHDPSVNGQGCKECTYIYRCF